MGRHRSAGHGEVATLARLEKHLNRQEITVNIGDSKRKFLQNSSQLTLELQEEVNKISESNLTWRDPLASKVISDESDLVQNLSSGAKKSFMRPSNKMRVQTPSIIHDMCATFVENFHDDMETIPQHLFHDNTWKESDETLANVTKNILDSLRDIWKNLAYNAEFVSAQKLDAFFQKYRIALEVQGAQHRLHSTSWYKDVKKLEDVVNRDRKKRCMCQDNGIFLLEVWYDEKPEI
ncbi:10163_t:CDS:2 [Diversispora eburnea]|uniref:10163_t:CDS:1 n=1 Tax=Diversispora eburnea TaxID=1213867 RepID=A0A9N9FPG1_9GLOM|nr:10163_t:CDS:2 [Diversispora eburnea]